MSIRPAKKVLGVLLANYSTRFCGMEILSIGYMFPTRNLGASRRVEARLKWIMDCQNLQPNLLNMK